MPHLPVTRRVPLPEPLTSAHACVRRDGRRIVAIAERSGSLWRLEIDPGRRTCDARPVPITVPRRADGKGWDLHDLSGSASLDRLLVWTDQARVHAVPSGDVLAELWVLREGAMCLSPGGRWVIRLEQERGTAMDLDATIPSWRETPSFHLADNASGEVEWVYLDHVDGIAVHPREGETLLEGEETFWLAAALYGEVLTHLVESDVDVRRCRGETRRFGPMVYDPTYLVRPWGHQHLFVLHGYGMGLVALDPATGARHDCLMRPPHRRTYAFFSGVVPCGQAPLAWGTSVDGSFLWRVGEDPVLMPHAPGAVLALYPDALLCLAPDGTELLWCDLPRAADG
ncbi:MAG TPA: hypothetical protein VGC13_07380 [Longimicrobium sp.]|jgi:hypothetical protein|uniref:hypothetical protein n=1 Tax=Longimicrobium sp. TaxID=2029185 RepID=UPI002ED95791